MGGIRGGSGGKGSSQCGPRCPSASASQNGSATEALLGSTADIFSEAITIQAMCSQCHLLLCNYRDTNGKSAQPSHRAATELKAIMACVLAST